MQPRDTRPTIEIYQGLVTVITGTLVERTGRWIDVKLYRVCVGNKVIFQYGDKYIVPDTPYQSSAMINDPVINSLSIANFLPETLIRFPIGFRFREHGSDNKFVLEEEMELYVC